VDSHIAKMMLMGNFHWYDVADGMGTVNEIGVDVGVDRSHPGRKTENYGDFGCRVYIHVGAEQTASSEDHSS
jgi:hypothetical protein